MEQSFFKNVVAQLVKKFPHFVEPASFFVFARARHLSLPRIRLIQHIPKIHFHKIHFNIIIPSTSRSSEWSPFRLSTRYFSFPHAIYVPRSSYPPPFNRPINGLSGEQTNYGYPHYAVPPPSGHSVHLRHKCSEHLVLIHPQSASFPYHHKSNFIPIKNKR
jgi:hypothetical protein